MTNKRKPLIWLTAVLAVITAVLTLTPSISWSVLAPTEILLRKWSGSRSDHINGYPGGPRLPNLAPNGNIEHDLVALLWKEPKDSDKAIYALVDRELPTAFGYAIAIRSLGSIGYLSGPPLPREPVRGPPARRLERYRLILEAAKKGASLEPDNCFFPLAQAIALQGLGRTAERNQAIARAAKCQIYNDYAIEQTNLQERVGLDVHGDRGTWVRRVEGFTSSSGELRSLARWIRLSETDRSSVIRRDFIQAMATMYRQAPDLFTLSRACGIVRGEYLVYQDPRQERDSRALTRAREVSPATEQLLKQCVAVQNYPRQEPDRFLPAADVTGFNAGVLASLILAACYLAGASVIATLPERWCVRSTRPLFQAHLMAKRWGAPKVIWFVLILLFGVFIVASGQQIAWYTVSGDLPETSGIVFALLAPAVMFLLPGIQALDLREGGRLWFNSLYRLALVFWIAFLALAIFDIEENVRWGRVFETEKSDASAIRAWVAEAVKSS